MEYFSHPKKLLSTHLNNVANGCTKIINKKNLNLTLITKSQLRDLIYIISIFHDFGKYNKDFQKKLLGDKDYNQENSYHSEISSLVCHIALREYCKKNNVQMIFSDVGAFLIKKHHGNLNALSDWFNIDKDKNQDKIFIEQFEEIIKIHEVATLYHKELKRYSVNSDVVNKNNFEKLIYESRIRFKKEFNKRIQIISEDSRAELFLITEFLFSVLVDCDKKDAAGFPINNSIKEISQNCVQNYLTEKRKEFPKEFDPKLKMNQIKNNIFSDCINNINLSKRQKIYSITAPTGAGKTLTSLATALKLKSLLENRENYKIHYVLPFTTIIDQNYNVFKETLQNQFNRNNENDYIMKHHYLTTEKLKKQNEEDRNYNFKSYMDELLFIKSWDSALVVSSYVQLLETIIGGKNSFMNKFHNIINSIIILDEVQCISSRYWNIFRELFTELANKFNTYFIFLTATQPLIFNRFEDKEECRELANPRDIFKERCLDRVKVHFDFKEKNIEEFVKEIKNIEEVKNRYLFILNTKKSSLELYKRLKEINQFRRHKKIYLSTNLTPSDRKKKLGGLSKDKDTKYIVVTTQLIEAGVDISSDICYRDFAPISSLIQSAGRVNRFGELNNKKGQIHFIKLRDEKRNKLFSDYVYSDEPVLKWTENVLEENIKSSKDFYELSKKFFEQSLTKDGKAKLLCQEEENAIKSLNFKHGFKFIENKPTHSVFILDENSKLLINEYKDTYSKRITFKDKKDFFIWNGKLKRIRKKFQKFIIEVWPNDFIKKEKYLKNNLKELGEDFYYLDTKDFPDLYNPETGFDLNYEQNNQV